MISYLQKSYLAGFLDGDGSIYVRLKPNTTYKYGFQVAPYIVFFQSQKDERKFSSICALVEYGHLRRRNDGILEYIISKQDSIRKFLRMIKPYLILKKAQADLMLEILDKKEVVENKNNFQKLMNLIDIFRELNYSKKKKKTYINPLETFQQVILKEFNYLIKLRRQQSDKLSDYGIVHAVSNDG